MKKKSAAPGDSESWIDWVAANWWVPLALLLAVIAAIGATAIRRRRRDENAHLNRLLDDTDIAGANEPTSKLSALRQGDESFVVEESGAHPMPDFSDDASGAPAPRELKPPDDTLSSETAVNLDQGDPLAEADFHMAYGLYDQAADLVRIALEREPERRDLRMKLLEIYFVWGNKDAFLQAAKGLEATRDRAPAGEWDKIVIMGKQICPDEPLFARAAGGGRGAAALVDLNLEGGENRVDIDLFGDPEGERSTLDPQQGKEKESAAAGEAVGSSLRATDHLDFTLDAPERGADESPTREMPPRDEPTVESELMNFGDAHFLDAPADAPTTESPALRNPPGRERVAAKLPNKADQTAEMSIDDLGLDLDDLERTGSAGQGVPLFEESHHPADAPTMIAGLDERSRRMMADADESARQRDLTDLERELEASFVVDLDLNREETKTAVLSAEFSPGELMPRDGDQNPPSRFQSGALDAEDTIVDHDTGSTMRQPALHADSMDLDLDRLASALGANDTLKQPRQAEDVFSSEVFEGAEREGVDLDVGEGLLAEDAPASEAAVHTNKLKQADLAMPDLEAVTMSEVGTKLDLARAYMDMGDPEGARSILQEVVEEGSASQKQEASRLIESLPG